MEQVHPPAAKKRRIYSKLPVTIVEDHHEVLKHIYRAIASRYLPFKGITMVHLDSHPDLQIPSKMPAQDVYKLEELSNYLSIENWIIPAVFSGHVSRLVWMKPPWADQLPEGSRQVTIGQHKSHGTIRIDWPDEYYISDVMFAPREDMINSKQLDLDIVTLSYRVGHKYSKYQTEEDLGLLSDSAEKAGNLEAAESDVDQISESSRTHSGEQVSSCRLGASHVRNDNGNIHSKDGNMEQNDSKEAGDHRLDAGSEESLTERSVLHGTEKETGELTGQSLHKTSAGHRECSSLNQKVMEAVASAVRAGEAFILDIDLDFFSTQNPFNLDYTPEQLAILKELFKFDAPKDESMEEINRAQDKRAKQLSDLREAIGWSLKEETQVGEMHSQRWHKMKEFIDGLRKNGKTSLDAELIHMAGETTCDDDEDLPHHVSSEQEINELIRGVKEVLSGQPTPIMITIARSSEDDYCPRRQVDRIQELVLNMLKELYGDLEVEMDYEQPNVTPGTA